jgi:Mce-associated membrane protein
MQVGTDPITDQSSPEPKNTGADIDIDQRPGDEAEAAGGADRADTAAAPAERGVRFSWTRFLACSVLPSLALMLTAGAGYLKWFDGSARESQVAAERSVQAATDSTVAILSYRPDTVERELKGAADRLTGDFRQQYTQLVSDVVAPGARQQHISATATVPAAASVSATENHAVVLVFVNQTTTIGNDSPTQTTSSVRITLDKVHDRWLISQFDPV